jgi:Flp pilus assembly pilin Flp
MLTDARTSQRLFQEYLMFKIRPVCYRLSERKGQTMTEYALLLAGIAVAAVAGYNSLGAGTNGAVNAASQLLASSSGSTSSGSGSGGSGSGGSGGGDTGRPPSDLNRRASLAMTRDPTVNELRFR